MRGRQVQLEFRIPIPVVVVRSKPIPKADVSIPPLRVGSLDEMHLVATATVDPPPEVAAIRQLVFELENSLVPRDSTAETISTLSARVRTPTWISTTGFAAKPGTAVLPMCSISRTNGARESRSSRSETANRSPNAGRAGPPRSGHHLASA